MSITAILVWVKYFTFFWSSPFYRYPEQFKADFSHLTVLVYRGSFYEASQSRSMYNGVMRRLLMVFLFSFPRFKCIYFYFLLFTTFFLSSPSTAAHLGYNIGLYEERKDISQHNKRYVWKQQAIFCLNKICLIPLNSWHKLFQKIKNVSCANFFHLDILAVRCYYLNRMTHLSILVTEKGMEIKFHQLMFYRRVFIDAWINIYNLSLITLFENKSITNSIWWKLFPFSYFSCFKIWSHEASIW